MPRYGGEENVVGIRPPGRPRRPPGRVHVDQYTPDYAALAKGTSRYMGWKASADQRIGGYTANRRANIRAMILAYGGLPPGFVDQYGDVDPALLAEAQQNKQSQTAQEEVQHQQNLHNMVNSTNSRGMINSGELGYGDTQVANQHANDVSALVQQLLAAARGEYGTYTGSVNDVNSEESGILDDIEHDPTFLEANPVEAATDAKFIPGSLQKYGQPVYKGANGKLYTLDHNGNPIKLAGLPDPKVNLMRRGLGHYGRPLG